MGAYPRDRDGRRAVGETQCRLDILAFCERDGERTVERVTRRRCIARFYGEAGAVDLFDAVVVVAPLLSQLQHHRPGAHRAKLVRQDRHIVQLDASNSVPEQDAGFRFIGREDVGQLQQIQGKGLRRGWIEYGFCSLLAGQLQRGFHRIEGRLQLKQHIPGMAHRRAQGFHFRGSKFVLRPQHHNRVLPADSPDQGYRWAGCVGVHVADVHTGRRQTGLQMIGEAS